MSEQDDTLVQEELEMLKVRADRLGLKYHPSIGAEKLREKIAAALNNEPPQDDEQPPAGVTQVPVETEQQKRLRMKQEAEKLVRIRVTCMNPAKKEWEGEIFCVGNSAVGSFKKFVPYNADEGWHVPNIIYQMLKDKECQVFTTTRDQRGNNVRRGKLIKEFAIEVLPPLSEEELHDLAQRQAMAKSID